MRVGEPSAAAARLRADPLTEVRATWACDEVGVLPELGGSSSFCFLSELRVGPVRRCRAGRKDDDRNCSIVPRNCWQTSEPWTSTDPTDYAPTSGTPSSPTPHVLRCEELLVTDDTKNPVKMKIDC